MMGEIVMDNVEIDSKIGGGAQIFTQSMEWERICLGALHLGTMQRLIEKTNTFVKKRLSGGQSINRYQAVSHKLADMYTQLEAARWLTYQSAWKLEENKNISLDASVTKLFVSETFRNFSIDLLQIFAGAGYMEDHEASRVLRDAMGSTIYSGTSEIQRNIIARWMR